MPRRAVVILLGLVASATLLSARQTRAALPAPPGSLGGGPAHARPAGNESGLHCPSWAREAEGSVNRPAEGSFPSGR